MVVGGECNFAGFFVVENPIQNANRMLNLFNIMVELQELLNNITLSDYIHAIG